MSTDSRNLVIIELISLVLIADERPVPVAVS